MIRTLVFIPSLVPVFGMAILWGWLFNRDFGLANYVLHQLGLSEQGWFQSESQALWMCIAVSFWAIGRFRRLPRRPAVDPAGPPRRSRSTAPGRCAASGT
jgi:hypothetical protein